MKQTYLAITLLLTLSWGCDSTPKEQPLPNLILVVADDLGISDLGCYGNDFIETPHLDRLAAEGIRFSQAYAAAPLCSPTRASLVTGTNPARLNLTEHLHGYPPIPPTQKLITPRIEDGLPLSTTSLAEMLKSKGYHAAHMGKWHLGGGDFSPENHGYDEVFGGSWAGLPGTFFYPFFRGGAYPELREGAEEGDYLTDRLTDEALSFIEKRKDTNFFLELNFYAPHVPIEGKEELVEKYRQKRNGEPDSLLPNVHYAAMVEAIDQNLGRLMEKLEALQLEKNTIILFVSDNGGLHVREVPAFAKHTPPTSNHPYKAGKGHLYEGGLRVPMILWGPALKGKKEYVASAKPVSTDDVFNTFAQLANSDVQSEDGLSLLQEDERPIFWHFPHYSPQGGLPGGVIRKGNYKLIQWYESEELELFDLSKDKGESQNLAKKKPELAAEMLKEFEDWKKKVGAREVKINPEWQTNNNN